MTTLSSSEKESAPIEIPADIISSEALDGLIDSFIMREGTDYGSQEIQHDKKVQNVRRLLDKEDVKIVFDPNTETVTILTSHEWNHLRKSFPQDEDELQEV